MQTLSQIANLESLRAKRSNLLSFLKLLRCKHATRNNDLAFSSWLKINFFQKMRLRDEFCWLLDEKAKIIGRSICGFEG